MYWIYLSPHLDDAVFSCGGLIHRQIQRGDQVVIWTICAGEPPPEPFSPFAAGQHTKWNLGSDATSIRRSEDRRACARLGASWRHLPVPDCIYRRSPDGGLPMYTSEEAIFGPLDPVENPLITELVTELAQSMPPEAQVVCPLGLGGHVDHRLTVSVAKDFRQPLWFYAEIPYVDHEPAWTGGDFASFRRCRVECSTRSARIG